MTNVNEYTPILINKPKPLLTKDLWRQLPKSVNKEKLKYHFTEKDYQDFQPLWIDE